MEKDKLQESLEDFHRATIELVEEFAENLSDIDVLGVDYLINKLEIIRARIEVFGKNIKK